MLVLRLATHVHFEFASEARMLHFTRIARTRLLLVDDDRQQLELCARVLRVSGFPVMTASHAQEALNVMAENAADVAILDYEMPEVNGCALAHEIRILYRNTRIVLYSGAASIPGSELTSVDAFLPKGKGPATLIGLILKLGCRSNGIEQKRASPWHVPEPCV